MNLYDMLVSLNALLLQLSILNANAMLPNFKMLHFRKIFPRNICIFGNLINRSIF